MARRRKHVKIVERKLGREQAWGQHCPETKVIELESRMRSRHYLLILIHELLHEAFPDLKETPLKKIASMMARAIWNQGFRRLAK